MNRSFIRIIVCLPAVMVGCAGSQDSDLFNFFPDLDASVVTDDSGTYSDASMVDTTVPSVGPIDVVVADVADASIFDAQTSSPDASIFDAQTSSPDASDAQLDVADAAPVVLLQCFGTSGPASCGGAGDVLPPWTFTLIDTTATASLLGLTASVPCVLSTGTDSLQCIVQINSNSTIWNLSYDPANNRVYISGVSSSCSSGYWTPLCQ